MQDNIRDHVSHMGSSLFQVGRSAAELALESVIEVLVAGLSMLSRAKHQRRGPVNGRLGFVAISLGLFTSVAASAPLIELPPSFWKLKLHIRKRLNEEQAVLVSVRTEAGRVDALSDRLVMSGVGWVKQAPAEVFARTQDFERLKEISDHFREVKFDHKTERLFIVSQALGYQARMLFQLKFDRAERKIHFEVIDGHFLGLRGLVEMAAIGDSAIKGRERITELSILMAHEARTLPIPKILIGFALEVIAKNVAIKMRRHLEAKP
jgi:hypothetical protein